MISSTGMRMKRPKWTDSENRKFIESRIDSELLLKDIIESSRGDWDSGESESKEELRERGMEGWFMNGDRVKVKLLVPDKYSVLLGSFIVLTYFLDIPTK